MLSASLGLAILLAGAAPTAFASQGGKAAAGQVKGKGGKKGQKGKGGKKKNKKGKMGNKAAA
jgi:hypothetical protein